MTRRLTPDARRPTPDAVEPSHEDVARCTGMHGM